MNYVDHIPGVVKLRSVVTTLIIKFNDSILFLCREYTQTVCRYVQYMESSAYAGKPCIAILKIWQCMAWLADNDSISYTLYFAEEKLRQNIDIMAQ